jgi:Putative DNA-binding domain
MPCMNSYFRKLTSVTEQGLNEFLEAQIPEDQHVEYKREFDLADQRNMETFLKEVAAFANSSGGDIFFGVEAINGIPVGAPGLQAFNADSEKLRLQNALRSRIAPRLFGVEFHVVPMSNGASVLIVRVPRASGPFMFGHRFYIRSGAEARPMDFTEVSQSFNEAEGVATQIRNFRLERCARIMSNEGPIELASSNFTVLHVVPLDAFAFPNRFTIQTLLEHQQHLIPMNAMGWNHGIDLEGVYNFSQRRDEKSSWSYSLLMRNGIVESAEGSWIKPRVKEDGSVSRFLPQGALESGVVEQLGSMLKLLARLEVEPPFAVFLSLLNVRGFTVPTSPSRPCDEAKVIRQDHLNLTEVMIPDYSTDIPKAMKSSFDAIWNACGFIRSPNYDANGDWKPR